jgi:hypothetical protein
MAGPSPAIKGMRERPHRPRLRFMLYSFGALLALFSFVVGFNVSYPEGLNIMAISLILWPPFLIAFTAALWLFLAVGEGDRLWVPIYVISLGGAVILLFFLGPAPQSSYNPGTYQGLYPSVTLISIAGVSISWWALDSRKSGRHGRKLYFGAVCLLLLLAFLPASTAIFYLIGFIPMTAASAMIWGWGCDPIRPKHDSGGKDRGLRIAIFFVTFFFIPFMVLFVPYYLFWAGFS